MLLILSLVVLVGFVLVAVAAVVWARHQVKLARAAAPTGTPREQLLALAAQAAGDTDGRQLLTLLKALDGPGPVRVNWLPRERADKTAGMLITITWDGNEWRHVHDKAQLRERLAAHVQDAAYDSPKARELLAALEG